MKNSILKLQIQQNISHHSEKYEKSDGRAMGYDTYHTSRYPYWISAVNYEYNAVMAHIKEAQEKIEQALSVLREFTSMSYTDTDKIEVDCSKLRFATANGYGGTYQFQLREETKAEGLTTSEAYNSLGEKADMVTYANTRNVYIEIHNGIRGVYAVSMGNELCVEPHKRFEKYGLERWRIKENLEVPQEIKNLLMETFPNWNWDERYMSNEEEQETVQEHTESFEQEENETAFAMAFKNLGIKF